jgi:hypothetical protein
MGKQAKKILELENDPIFTYTEGLKVKLINSESTKRKYYINPSLQPFKITKELPEYHHISSTRIRLQSHHLKIETEDGHEYYTNSDYVNAKKMSRPKIMHFLNAN